MATTVASGLTAAVGDRVDSFGDHSHMWGPVCSAIFLSEVKSEKMKYNSIIA
jgi:hypothetical protein